MLKSYFSYSKSDRKTNSIILVILILVAVFWLGKTIGSSEKDNGKEPSTRLMDVDSISNRKASDSTQDVSHQHTFDPNTVDAATLMKLGIAKNKAVALVHYRESGKVFSSENDVLSTYNWTPEDIELIRPYMRIGEEFQRKVKSRPNYTYEEGQQSEPINWQRKDSSHHEAEYTSNKFTSPTTVDPNSADTTLLQRIPGIGKYFSRQIVIHRERLGGYVCIEQLCEILNFPKETLSWFEIKQKPALRKINLNAADFRQLASHPYIGYKHTKDIQNYIRLNGTINNIEQLRSTGIFTDAELEQLIPYLELK